MFHNNVQSSISHSADSSQPMVERGHLANTRIVPPMEGQSQGSFIACRGSDIQETRLYRQPQFRNEYNENCKQYEGNIQERNRSGHPRPIEIQSSNEYEVMETPSETSGEGPIAQGYSIDMRNVDVDARQAAIGRGSELESLPSRDEEFRSTLEGSSTVGGQLRRGRSCASDVVIASFNCEGWKSPTILALIHSLSYDNTNNIVLCLQETWLYRV